MTNKIPSGMEEHHESTEPESSKTANSSILYGAVHNPIAFA